MYLPLLKRLGVEAELDIKTWGWYPRGGGEVELRVRGGSSLQGIDLLERGSLGRVRGLAAASGLPPHIPQRMARRAGELLEQAGLAAEIETQQVQGLGPGTGIFLTAEYEVSRAGFAALGRRGLPAEAVAEMAVRDFLAFHQSGAPLEQFLGDQILLPLALAASPSQYRTAQITEHLRTNAWVIEQFGLARVAIAPERQQVTLTFNNVS